MYASLPHSFSFSAAWQAQIAECWHAKATRDLEGDSVAEAWLGVEPVDRLQRCDLEGEGLEISLVQSSSPQDQLLLSVYAAGDRIAMSAASDNSIHCLACRAFDCKHASALAEAVSSLARQDADTYLPEFLEGLQLRSAAGQPRAAEATRAGPVTTNRVNADAAQGPMQQRARGSGEHMCMQAAIGSLMCAQLSFLSNHLLTGFICI